MNPILILFAHPRFEQSRINRALLRAVAGVPGVTIHDLYEHYPDFNIQVEREKALLASARIVIWQHPFYMYGAPALLKQWLDLVLEFGWAHGSGGDALQGKIAFNVVTTGGARESYQRTGRNRFTIGEFLVPFDQTASLCDMIYLPPFAVQGTYLLTDQQLDRPCRPLPTPPGAAVRRRLSAGKARSGSRCSMTGWTKSRKARRREPQLPCRMPLSTWLRRFFSSPLPNGSAWDRFWDISWPALRSVLLSWGWSGEKERRSSILPNSAW